jgi:hypothetical protein
MRLAATRTAAIAPARSLTSPPRRAALTSGHVPSAQAGPRARLLTRLARTTAPACSRLFVTSPLPGRAHVPDTRQRAQDARRLRSCPLRSGGPTRLTPDAAGPDYRSGSLTPTQPYQASLHSPPFSQAGYDADPPHDTSPLRRTGPRARLVTRMAGPASSGAGPSLPALPHARSSGAALATYRPHGSCASVASYRQVGVPGWPSTPR